MAGADVDMCDIELAEAVAREPQTRLVITAAQTYAAARGGLCLNTTWRGEPLRWCCGRNHSWSAPFEEVVVALQWCAECAATGREEQCRQLLHFITGAKFIKCCPAFLKEPGRRQLELDGYCKALSLAFEHQGRQHYARVPHFQKTEEAFAQQLENDKWKAARCSEHGVALIVVPYYETDIAGFLIARLAELGWAAPAWDWRAGWS